MDHPKVCVGDRHGKPVNMGYSWNHKAYFDVGGHPPVHVAFSRGLKLHVMVVKTINIKILIDLIKTFLSKYTPFNILMPKQETDKPYQ